MSVDDALDRIRRRLGRGGGPPPPPPVVHEPTARRVYSDLGLPELFVHAARRGGMSADLVHVEGLVDAVADHLRRQGVSAVHVAATPMLRKVRLAAALAAAGVATAADPGGAIVSSCDTAVSETGTLAFAGGLPAGWLAAGVRVVVLEPKNFVPDLVDLLTAGGGGDAVLVSGPTVRVFVLH